MRHCLVGTGSQSSARCLSGTTCAYAVHPTRSLGYSYRVVLDPCIIDADLKFRRPAESNGTLLFELCQRGQGSRKGASPVGFEEGSPSCRVPPRRTRNCFLSVSARVRSGFRNDFTHEGCADVVRGHAGSGVAGGCRISAAGRISENRFAAACVNRSAC